MNCGAALAGGVRRRGREGGAPAAPPPLFKFAIRVCRLVFAADLISFINWLSTAMRSEVACIVLSHDHEITKIRTLGSVQCCRVADALFAASFKGRI